MRKRVVSVVLSLALCLSMLPTATWASGTGGVSYYDPVDGISKTAENVTTVTEKLETWEAGWYVVDEVVAVSSRITVNGDVNLILAKGGSLDAQEGITVSGDGNSLAIWGQSADDAYDGELIAAGAVNSAGIGGEDAQDCSPITINGGKIIATGGNNAAGIGGGRDGIGSDITINGGVVVATGGEDEFEGGPCSGAGIGGGYCGDGCQIEINGGVVTASGGRGAAGIGGGGNRAGHDIIINAGAVTATGGSLAAGIGGGFESTGSDIMITGGIVTVSAGDEDACAISATPVLGDFLHVTFGNADEAAESKTPVEWTGQETTDWSALRWVRIQPLELEINITTKPSSVIKSREAKLSAAFRITNPLLTERGDEVFDTLSDLASWNWSIETTDISTETAIGLDGTLCVAADEAQDELTVRAALSILGSELSGTTNVPLIDIPFVITGQPQDATVYYGYQQGPTLSITLEESGTADPISCQWYEVAEDEEDKPVQDVNGTTFTLSTGLSVGVYTYYCVVTADGLEYSEKSSTATVTVLRSGAEFTDGIRTYFNNIETRTFTLDKTITVKAMVSPTAAFAMMPPVENQAAVFEEEEQLTEAQDAAPGKELTFAIAAARLGVGDHILSVRYVGDENMADAVGTAAVTVQGVPTVVWAESSQTVTYTGSAAQIIPPIVALPDGNTYQTEITYTYREGGGEEQSGLPTDAGIYTVIAHIQAQGYYTEAHSEEMILTISKAAALDLTNAVSMLRGRENYSVTIDLTKTAGYPEDHGGTPVFVVNRFTNDGLTGATVDEHGILTLISSAGKNNVTDTVTVTVSGMVNYEDSTITVTVTYTDATLISINIQTQPRRAYKEEDRLDLSELMLEAIWSDGVKTTLSYDNDGVEATPAHGTVLTTDDSGRTVTVSYNGISVETETITVNKVLVIPDLQIGGDGDMRLLVEDGISSVPDGLQETQFNTAEAIVEELSRVLAEGMDISSSKNQSVYDAVLQVSRDGGVTWEDATADNFPDDGLTVTLPYPKGTDSSYRFTVVHMFTANAFGKEPGSTEKPDVTNTENGIRFIVMGLSPISIAWEKSESAPPVPPTSPDSPVPPTSPDPPVRPSLPRPPAPSTPTAPPSSGDVSSLMPEDGCDGGPDCPSHAFADIDTGAWYYKAADEAIHSGLLSGYENDLFGPDDTLSRAMAAQILYNLEDRPAVNVSSGFSDVPDGAWFADAVTWAAATGIVNGYNDNIFAPEDPITREQFAVMLYRHKQSMSVGSTGMWMFRLDFADGAEVSNWAYEAMCWCVRNSVIDGKGNGILDPKGQATRAEAAVMLMRFLACTTA